MRWASVLIWFAGCTVAVEDYGRAMGQAKCEREQRCGWLVSSVDCTRPGYWSDTPPELSALAAGQVGYSASSAAACIERHRAASCGANVSEFEECRSVFPGKLVEGAACGFPFDACEPGLLCADRNGISCGTCLPTTPQGGTPAPSHPCGRGLRRGISDGGVFCIPRATVGEACASPDDCLERLWCIRLNAMLVGTCEESNIGPARDGGTETSLIGTEGQQCSNIIDYRMYGTVQCREGLHCVNERCAQLSDFEETCAADDDCVSKHCVDEACAAPRGAGATCTAQNCGGSNECVNGVCTPFLCQ